MKTDPHSSCTSSTPEVVPGHIDGTTRALGVITLIGVATITIICIVVQFLRTDLDWINVEMSLYVIGPWGIWVQASFFAPAPGLATLGVGWYRSLDRSARHAAPLALFVAAAIALCFTAANVADPTPHPTTLHGQIHQWSAFATFVCATTAMLLQAWLMRRDARCRGRCPAALTIAVVAVIYFWVYALFKPIPRGLGEKVVIGLVLLWMWRAAWWLVRGTSSTRHPPAS